MATPLCLPGGVLRDRKERIVRQFGLLTVAIIVFWVPGAQATSPPNLSEALRVQQAQADQNPGDPGIWNDLGNLLVLAGSLGEAEEAYRLSLEMDPDNTTTRYNLALVLLEQGHTKQATKELHHLLELDPDHGWSLYQLGTISASVGRRRKAVDYYTRALTVSPELASPAVNPHIVENRHFTESQLRLYLTKAEAAQAPRLYQRPGQVANLLVPTSIPEPTSTPFVELVTEPVSQPESRTLTWHGEPSNQAGEATPEMQPATGDESIGRPPADQEEPGVEDSRRQTAPTESSDSSLVLTEEDLVPTNVGQGVGYTGPAGQPSSTRTTGRAGETASYPRTTTPRSGSPSRPAPPQRQTVPPQTQATPRSQSFVPTIGSTGRLELELLVEDGSTAIAPGP